MHSSIQEALLPWRPEAGESARMKFQYGLVHVLCPWTRATAHIPLSVGYITQRQLKLIHESVIFKVKNVSLNLQMTLARHMSDKVMVNVKIYKCLKATKNLKLLKRDKDPIKVWKHRIESYHLAVNGNRKLNITAVDDVTDESPNATSVVDDVIKRRPLEFISSPIDIL